jgi:hypothetical protein
MSSFTQAEHEFDETFSGLSVLSRSYVPVNGKIIEDINIRPKMRTP